MCRAAEAREKDGCSWFHLSVHILYRQRASFCRCSTRRSEKLAMTRRVLTARILHETNTFSRIPTDMAAFRANGFFRGNEIPGGYRGTRSAMGGSLKAAEKFGW